MTLKASFNASLYVGDLAPDVTEGVLFQEFNSVGPVTSIRVCRDAMTKRSLGYAYVNFNSVIDAERALDTLNNTIINHRPCRIMWSQRDPTLRKTGKGNIYIKNLAPTIGMRELNDTFSAFGDILSCKVALNEKGESKGFGFVHFKDVSAAEKAIHTVNGKILGGRTVYVMKWIPKKDRMSNQEKAWTNIYIKNLDPEEDDEKLKRLFTQFGEITSAKVMRNIDQSSLSFGFVNFARHEDAVKALQTIENSDSPEFQNSNSIKYYVNRAQPKEERRKEIARRTEQFRQELLHRIQGSNLYVKNLEDIKEDVLSSEFLRFGTLTSVHISRDEKGNSRGFGFVCFSNPDEALRAKDALNGQYLPGSQKPLIVNLHEPKEIRQAKLSQQGIPRGPPRNPGIPQSPQAPFYQQIMFLPQKPRWGPPQSPINPNYFVPFPKGTRPAQPFHNNLYERLFIILKPRYPTIADIVSTFLLRTQDPSELELLVQSEEKLLQKINEAKKILEDTKQRP